MSFANHAPTQRRGPAAVPSTPEAAPSAVEFHYHQTDNFAPLLQWLNISLLVTTYQANKLLVVRAAQGGLSTLVRTFERPMGLAVDGHRLALGPAIRSGFYGMLRTSPRASSRPGIMTPAFYRAPATSREISASMRWPGRATNCGSSIRASPASARSTPTTASCRAGCRLSSPARRPRIGVTSTAWRSSRASRNT